MTSRRDAPTSLWSLLRPSVTVLGCLLVVAAMPLAAIGLQLTALQGAESASESTKLALAKLTVWLALVAVQALCWVLVVAWSVPVLSRLARELGNSRRVAYRCVLPPLILLLPWVAVSLNHLTRPSTWLVIGGVSIFPVVGLVGVVVAGLATSGLFVVYERARIAMTAETRDTPVAAVLKLGQLVNVFHQFLYAAATVFALGIVGTAALFKAAGTDHANEFTVVYGIAGSLFLLAAYAPLRLGLYRESARLIERAMGQAPDTTKDLADWMEQRDQLERLLGQDANSFFGLGGVITTLVPMVVGAASQLLA